MFFRSYNLGGCWSSHFNYQNSYIGLLPNNSNLFIRFLQEKERVFDNPFRKM
jgi:hypothetical protein